MSSPGDGYDVFTRHDGVIITLKYPVFHLENLHRLLQALWIQSRNITHNQSSSFSSVKVHFKLISQHRANKKWKCDLYFLVSELRHLTRSLHGDFELSAAGSFSVNFKICHFFHPQTLRLQTSARSSAGVRVAGCKDGSEGDVGCWLDWKMMLK